MGLYGRRDIPGEASVGDAIDQRGVLDRTIRAQVRTVDAENGIVVLVYENLPSGGKYVTAAPLWMSFPDAKIGNPAWGRFMPQEGDLVRVSFDYDDRPVIVGYDIIGEMDSVADGLTGWPAINKQYKDAAGNEDCPPEKAKFAQFTPINPGEYDFMSNGGAYIYGNNQGRLYLAGGTVSITLIKNDLRISGRAQLWSHSADDCELRFGQVRRVDPSDNLDKKVSVDSDGKFKEFGIVLKKTIEAGQTSDIATLKMGNVVDDSGAVQNSVTASQPARLWFQAFDDSGTEVLKTIVDNLGNWDVIATDQATTGLNFDFAKGAWTAKTKTLDWNVSDTYKVKCPEYTFTADTSYIVYSDKVYLGGNSDSDQTFKLTDNGLEIGVGPTDYMALASLVKGEISALRDTVNTFITSTYNSHTHQVVGIQTAGSPVAHTQTAPVPTLVPTQTGTAPAAVKDVKSSFVKSL